MSSAFMCGSTFTPCSVSSQVHWKTLHVIPARMATENPAKGQDVGHSVAQSSSVLFVCLGNICRSPAAEAIFRRCVGKRGLASRFVIDSAGTIDYHQGDPADARMREAARVRGVNITSISRPICPDDLDKFDHIMAMDRRNKQDILRAWKNWATEEVLGNKVRLICDYCQQHAVEEVPDPYYGGPDGFEKVLDLLEDACEGLLTTLVVDTTAR